MAWFKRNRDEAPAEDPAGSVAPGPAPEPEGAVEASPAAPAEPAVAPAWTTAPPMASVIPTIQRSLGRIEARDATTLGRPAPLSLAPLGHAVTPDAPAGVIGTVTVADQPAAPGHLRHDEPPLDYVQRAPAGAPPARPAPPAQLLVPSFQPSQLPSVPVAAPEVQRAAATPSLMKPSFTTAPNPSPPLVLPVGEILSPPVQRAPAPAPAPVPAAAPLLADAAAAVTPPDQAVDGADVQRAPEVALPLAPVQRHADHPGHVDGDEAPAESDAPVQRAPLASPAAPPASPAATPDAPLLPGSPLAPVTPLLSPDTPAGAEVAPAAEVDLPLAPVQRHADHADHPDHPGHVDLLTGDRAPTEAPGTGEVQRAPVDSAPPLAPGAPSAPLVGDSPPLTTPPAVDAGPEATGAGEAAGRIPDLPLPTAPVQRSAAPARSSGLGRPIPAIPTDAVQPGAVKPGSVQRAPVTPPPAAPSPPAPTAPLVGSEPLQPAAPLPLAAVQRAAADDGDAPDEEQVGPSAAADQGGPSLDLAQRAPVDAPAPSPAPTADGDGSPVAATEVAPLLGDSPLAPSPGLAPAADPHDHDAPAAAGTPAPELGLVQRAPIGAGTSSPTSPATTPSSSTSATTTSPAAALPPLVVAPLLGGRPFATLVQRSAGTPATASSGLASSGLVDRDGPEALSPEPGRVYQPLAGIGMWNGAPPPDLPGPAIEAPPSHVAAAVQRATGTDVSNVRIRRDTGVTAQRLAARAFTHEGEVHIPASVGSLASGEGASLATHELVHAGQQSVLGSSRPHEHTPEGQALEAQARSAEHASLAGLELPKMPLAAPAVQRASAEATSSGPFSPQQLNTLMSLADNPPTSGSSAYVQREAVEAPPQPAAEAPATPPGAAPEAAARQQTPEELEELATKLFPSLRNLFRTELLGFRRRSGTSADRPLI